MKIHFVKAGESLYEIGIKYGVTIEELVAANKSIIDPNLIMAGMKLIIPVKQMQTPNQMQNQTSNLMQTQDTAPDDSIVPSIPQYPANQNMPAQMPTQTMLPNQNMPAQMPTQTMLPNQNMPVQLPIQTMVPNQSMPSTHSAPANQYPLQLPEYPGQAMPPFAATPIPAQQVTAPIAMPMAPTWGMPTAPTWSMPVEYTPYNTPYHMTNYTAPNSYPNPSPNIAYQGMAQVNGNYQPYSSNAMPYSSNENYEYYNTYSTLQNNAAWPLPNPQPHAQMAQVQFTQDNNKAQPDMQQEADEAIDMQKENKRVRTSTSSKGNNPTRTRKSTLHDQVMKLQQTRNRR